MDETREVRKALDWQAPETKAAGSPEEGFTDIRFVVGLSEICELTMIVPTRTYRASGLAERVAHSGATLRVIEIPGGRLAFQTRSLRALWQHPPYFHDGSAKDLPAVVDHYVKQFGLKLTDDQKFDLVEFLKSL